MFSVMYMVNGLYLYNTLLFDDGCRSLPAIGRLLVQFLLLLPVILCPWARHFSHLAC